MEKIEKFEGEFYFLSNFYPASVMYNGDVWITAEHAFQAAKTLHPSEKLWVGAQGTPGRAKKAGQAVTLRPDWEEVKLAIMKDIVRLKFFTGRFLANRLVQTHPATLVEGNYWGDTFWGVCQGEGENHLGLILMDVREQLMKGVGDV